MATHAEHQRAFRARQKEEMARLRARVVELEAARATGHAACDALERDLRAEIELLRAGTAYMRRG